MFEAETYIRDLENVYRQHGNPIFAEGASRYMKYHFPFFGVKTPLRRELATVFIKIIYQLGYKQKTDAQRLFANVLRRADSKEFFVQKGAGWVLREYAKVNPVAVQDFVEGNKLPALTAREALRIIKANRE